MSFMPYLFRIVTFFKDAAGQAVRWRIFHTIAVLPDGRKF